jgi:multiple sugar transport system substrate-binding protein
MSSAILSRRDAIAGLAALLVIGGAVSACGSTAGSGSSPAAASTYTVWDPYPQFDNNSAWVQLLKKCGSSVLLAAQQGVAPEVLIVDNPVVSTLAQAEVLTDTATTKVSARWTGSPSRTGPWSA